MIELLETILNFILLSVIVGFIIALVAEHEKQKWF